MRPSIVISQKNKIRFSNSPHPQGYYTDNTDFTDNDTDYPHCPFLFGFLAATFAIWL